MLQTCHFRNVPEKQRELTQFLRKHGDKLPDVAIRKSVSRPLIGNWVSRCDGKKIVSAATYDENDWYLCTFHYLATDPAYRGRGLGTAVMKELVQKARKNPSCLVMAADVTFDNEPSKRIMKKIGLTERSRFCWGKGQKPADVLHYVRFPPSGGRCKGP